MITEQEWINYLFFGGPFPTYAPITVPFPVGFKPIDVKYEPSEHVIEVTRV